MTLTIKRKIFLEEYLRCWNGSEAARKAGYAFPNREAYRLLSNADIVERVEERMEDLMASADEAMVRLSKIARAPQSEFLTTQGYDMAKIAENCPDMVKKYTRTASGVTIEFYDQLAALKIILQLHQKVKPATPKVEIEGFAEILEKVYGDQTEKE